jgi:hypothetical protein
MDSRADAWPIGAVTTEYGTEPEPRRSPVFRGAEQGKDLKFSHAVIEKGSEKVIVAWEPRHADRIVEVVKREGLFVLLNLEKRHKTRSAQWINRVLFISTGHANDSICFETLK